MSDIKEMTMSDLAPYILGKEHFEAKKNPPERCNQQVLEDFLTMIEGDSIAKQFLATYDSPKDFYVTMKDFAHAIPKEQQSEVFYAAKNGVLYYEVPSSCVFVLKKAYEAARGIPNLILKFIPFALLQEYLSEGYLFGYTTLHDVISTVCDANYYPLSVTHLRNKINKFTEIYVPSTDMVAAVPSTLSEWLTDNDILELEVQPTGLTVKGTDKPIRVLGGFLGSVNSIYDLRQLL